MKLLSIGDKVQQGNYKIHSRFDRVVNFLNKGCFVSLVEKEIGAGPLNIVIKGVNLDTVHVIEIKRRSIILENIELDFQKDLYYHSGIDYKNWDINTFNKNLAIFEKLLIKNSHPMSLAFLLDERRIEHFHTGFEKGFVKQIANGVHKIYNGQIINGVKMLKGCGFGLTPSGDDFIAGLLLALNFIQKMFGKDFNNIINNIYEVSKGENIFSNTFLQLAKDGLLFEKMKKLLAAIIYCREKEILHCMEKLFSIGETSGADLCTGFFMTLQSVFNRRLLEYKN